VTATLHERLARDVVHPLLEVVARARPGSRASAVAYREGLRFRQATADWPDERRHAWILERLRTVVRAAAEQTAYYAEAFEREGFDPQAPFGFDDFARLPVLDRETVGVRGLDLVSRAVPADQLKRDATGGSTGAPTVVWHGPEERGWSESGIEHSLAHAGARRGTRIGFLWGHHLDPVTRDSLRARTRDLLTNVRWFDCFRLSPAKLDAYHHELQGWRPACVVAYAGALAALADHVAERGYRPAYPRTSFVTGAEKLLPAQRMRIERVFGKPAHERYGSRDAGQMAFQLSPEASPTFAVDWQNVLLEPVDDTETPGILVTKLHADGMPMIRYRVGDLARFPRFSAPGHPALELLEVVGRDVDRIALPDGRWVHPIEFPHLMKDHPVKEWTVYQYRDYRVEVRIVPGPGFDESSRAGILSLVEANLQGVPVDLAVVDELPRTRASKLRPVISELTGESNVPADGGEPSDG
jgi:phenylacetate-CoA ligase